MFKTYLREIFAICFRSSRALANGVFGAALGGGAMIWWGVLPIFHGHAAAVVAVNWVVSFLICSAISWFVFFIFHAAFIAPYQVWSAERDRRAAAERANAPRAKVSLLKGFALTDGNPKCLNRLCVVIVENISSQNLNNCQSSYQGTPPVRHLIFDRLSRGMFLL